MGTFLSVIGSHFLVAFGLGSLWLQVPSMGQGMEEHGDALAWSFAACALLLCFCRVSFF